MLFPLIINKIILILDDIIDMPFLFSDNIKVIIVNSKTSSKRNENAYNHKLIHLIIYNNLHNVLFSDSSPYFYNFSF